MNTEKLGGGFLVGAASVVLFTHGADYTEVEIGSLSAGAGAAITYLVTLAERLLGSFSKE